MAKLTHRVFPRAAKGLRVPTNDGTPSRRQPTDGLAAQFETISALQQWRFWLAVLSAATALLAIAYFIKIPDGETGEQSLIGYAMYLVIGGLTAYLVYKGYRDVQFLDRETKLASEQVKLLEREDFLAKAEPSVFKSHIVNLYQIARSHPEVSQDNLIEILHSRLMARNRVVELFASVLITLGLIGTIVGLMVMMDNLQTQIMAGTGGGTDEMIRKLFGPGGALGGLSTAFVTTLLGAVFGGVVLRVLTSVVDASIMRYTAHLAELTEVYVLPSMRRMAQAMDSPEGQQPDLQETMSSEGEA